MDGHELKESESRDFGRRVREELARRRISRQALADMARISLSTLEKALAGARPFTLASKIRIEEALGAPFRPAETAPNASAAAAPDRLGAYVRAAVRWLEGRYLTLRPSFGSPGSLFTYITEIAWSDASGHLVFSEQERLDAEFQQRGEVSLPHLSGHIYLSTNDHGQQRLAILSRPTITGSMFGLLTTLQVGNGSQLIPSACPLALVPKNRVSDPLIGLVESAAGQYEDYRALLSEATAKDFARFHI